MCLLGFGSEIWRVFQCWNGTKKWIISDSTWKMTAIAPSKYYHASTLNMFI